ncbi:MAG: hypothetical protein ACTSRN_06440, partial [Alphaproteobacteria bacterium]
MISDLTGISIADWIAIIGLTLTSVAIFFGVIQYNQREKWKEKLSLSHMLEEFHSDKRNKSALNMLDYDGGWVDMFPDYNFDTIVIEGKDFAKFQRVSHAEIELSLTNDRSAIKHMDLKLFRIREIFDYLLNDLEKLNMFLRSGLFDSGDVLPFIDYYIGIIGKDYPN